MSRAWASAALALLDDATASPASRCLASARAALGTRHILILGQAPRLGNARYVHDFHCLNSGFGSIKFDSDFIADYFAAKKG
jgi:hypothetical protein